MLTTTLAFFALTALLIWLHLRAREAPSPSQGRVLAAGGPCPRCNAMVPSGATFCPSCGVPQQVFDVVRAPASSTEAAATPAAGVMRALVRADMCVGCGTCVAECPEPGAITMRGKLAVVDDAKCQGHGACVRGCPVGAISMNSGAAVNRVSVPLVDANFETNVLGLYIVGELGGRGLIKNAINEGKLAIEHVRRSLPPSIEGAEREASVVEVAVAFPTGEAAIGILSGTEVDRMSATECVGQSRQPVREACRQTNEIGLTGHAVHPQRQGGGEIRLWRSPTLSRKLLYCTRETQHSRKLTKQKRISH